MHTNSIRLRLSALEDRTVPALFPLSTGIAAISPDDGGEPRIKFVDPFSGEDLGELEAYEGAFRGGVRTALGDVTGDGTPDLVIAPGRGGGPRIKIVDGQSGATLKDFFVYEPTFTGGIYVAVGDVNGDGRGDLITGTGNGGGPRVRVLDGASLGATVLRDFFAYENTFRGGVLVAAGDTDGDGRDDVITGTGIGGGPRVQVFSGLDDRLLRNFFAYEHTFRGGVQVGGGDIDGDSRDDVLTGTGPGGGPVVRVTSGATGTELAAFLADDPLYRGGIRVEAEDVNRDGFDDLLTETRHGNEERLRVFDGRSGSFIRSLTRTVDDNPSPNDLIERPGGILGLTPGTVSYIEGTIAAVNAAAGTVDLRLGNGTVVIVQSGPGTSIERNGVHTTLSTFVVGEKGEAQIGPDGIAWEIEAKTVPTTVPPPSNGVVTGKIEGTIAAINVAENSVSIRRQSGELIVVRTGPATEIERNDVHTTLAAFVAGDRGEALIGSDGVAVKVEATVLLPVGGGGGTTTPPSSPAPNSRIEGTLTALDLAAGTASIRASSGTVFLIRTNAATDVERNDLHTTLSAFQVGDFAQARIGSDGIAFKLEAVG